MHNKQLRYTVTGKEITIKNPLPNTEDSTSQEVPEEPIEELPATTAKAGSVNASNPAPTKRDNTALNTVTGKEITIQTPPPVIKTEDSTSLKEPEEPIEELPATTAKAGAVNTSTPTIPIERDNAALNTVTGKEITIQAPPPIIKKQAADTKTAADTITKKPLSPAAKPPVNTYGFTFDSELPHFAIIVLNKVDIVFGNEAKNAFNRYNKEKYFSQPLNIQLLNIDADNKLLLVGDFANAQAAIDYVQQARQLATTQIIPWLKENKYSFSIISNANLEVLKAKPDLTNYQRFLEKNTPVKF